MSMLLVTVFTCILCTVNIEAQNEKTVLKVAGTDVHLPLKVTVVSNVVCSPSTTKQCPRGNTSSFGPGMDPVGSIQLARSAINEDPDLWPVHNFTFSILNSEGFTKNRLRYGLQAVSDPDTLAVFGPEEGCDQAEYLAGLRNKLLINHYCTTANQHATTVQTAGQLYTMADAVVSFIKSNGWDRVVIVYFYYPNMAELEPVHARLQRALLERGVRNVKTYRVRTSGRSGLQFERYTPQEMANMVHAALLKETFLLTRAYILLSVDTLNGADVYYFLDIMGRYGLLQTGEYAVMSLYPSIHLRYYDGSTTNVPSSQYFLNNRMPGPLRIPLREEMFQNFRSSVLFIEQSVADTTAYRRVMKNLGELSTNFSRNASVYCPPLCNINIISPAANVTRKRPIALLYESIMSYARLLSRLIKENSTDITDGYAMKQHFYGFRSEGDETVAPVVLDGAARASERVMLSTATYAPDGREGIYCVGLMEVAPVDNTIAPKLQTVNNMSFNWLYGRPPPAGPKCGFVGERCLISIQKKTWIIVAFSALATALIVTVSIYYWRHHVFEKNLEKALWKILLKDLVLHADVNRMGSQTSMTSSDGANMGSTSTLRMHRSRRFLQDDTELLIKEQQKPEIETTPKQNQQFPLRMSKKFRTRKANLDQWNNIGPFAIALLQGKMVALKRVYKKPVSLTRTVKEELWWVTSLRHPNINPLMGVVHEPPVIMLVSEYCTKGSLKDMLENDEIKLDRIMRASIVFDIVDGLRFLHQSRLHCHGRLKSSNCLIDSKWVLRLSEFGLFQFLQGEENPVTQEEKCKKLLWTAPEILRIGFENSNGTPQGDIYAFGIILHEIFGRQGPFGDQILDPVEVIQKLKLPKLEEPLFRPNMLSVSDAPDFIKSIMKECWDEENTNRPNIIELKEKLEPLRAGMSTNLLDNIAMMIEKYNNNLEELVAERVREIEVEKAKSDALLAEMLPMNVANALREGMPVEPERFDCVTIYFSDIVGFGDIVRQCSAFQVVTFLHNVFTSFDGMVGHFDVYKVETIGDSYVAVSGLPRRNGDNHAGEVASMALCFIKSAKDRKFYQPNGDIVPLRIGIHSGPCVAGVVGLLMPRYCLFGDTVNTASRMESNGQALKIHCSAECKRILDSLGGYHTEERGYVKMKGKGEKFTYWLSGKNGKEGQNGVKPSNTEPNPIEESDMI